MSLTAQQVVIIGGSSGMGLATAQRLVRRGARVVISGRSPARLEAAVASLGEGARGIAADFSDPQSLAALFEQTGTVDHLVLAASRNAAWGPFNEISPARLRQALEGKLIGYWQSLQAALPRLRRDGSVVMLGGAASRTALPGTAGLAAVNGGIVQLAHTLARELAPLRINVVSPGLVDTAAYDGLPAEAKQGLFAGTAQKLLVGRTGLADEVAEVVEMLLGNGFTTDAVIDVDGGAR